MSSLRGPDSGTSTQTFCIHAVASTACGARVLYCPTDNAQRLPFRVVDHDRLRSPHVNRSASEPHPGAIWVP